MMIGIEQTQSFPGRHPREIRKRFWEKESLEGRDTRDRTRMCVCVCEREREKSAREMIEILSPRWISLIATPVLLLRI